MGDAEMALTQVAALGDQKTKIEKYKELLQGYISKALVPHLKAFLEHISLSEVPLVVSRQVNPAMSLPGAKSAHRETEATRAPASYSSPSRLQF